MAPQEKVSILCEILDGYFIRVVVSKVCSGRTVVLSASNPRLY